MFECVREVMLLTVGWLYLLGTTIVLFQCYWVLLFEHASSKTLLIAPLYPKRLWGRSLTEGGIQSRQV